MLALIFAYAILQFALIEDVTDEATNSRMHPILHRKHHRGIGRVSFGSPHKSLEKAAFEAFCRDPRLG